MSFLDQLERRAGWLAFPGFLRFYAILHALVFVLSAFNPFLGDALAFNRELVLSGEVWRVVTFLFASSAGGGVDVISILIMFFIVMIAFMISDALEGAWGVFRATIFYYTGIICLVLANFLMPSGNVVSGFAIYLSAFFAFATLFPRVEFLILLIIPVQVRYLAWFTGGLQFLGAIAATVEISGYALPFFIISYANYMLFAGIPALRGTAMVIKSSKRRKKFNATQEPEGEAFYTCSVCKKSDVSDPGMEFRVGPDGEEYCEEHLPKGEA